MNTYTRCLFLFTILLTMVSCGNQSDSPQKEIDGPTRGEIDIVVDETFRPVIESLINTHATLYKKAKINARYVSENEAFNALMDKSARMAVVSRRLNDEERQVFKSWTITPKEIKVGTDAICLIVNNANLDTVFTMDRLKLVLNGTIKSWSELDPNSNLNSKNDVINVVFDHAGSSTVRFMRDSLLIGDSLKANVFATGSNQEVFKYVKENPGAIGVVGLNWISDLDDQRSTNFLSGVRVVKLNGPKGSKVEDEFFQPYQAYLALGHYPLTRELLFVMNEPRMGLGTGFANWVAGEKGQRLILKAGLYPNFMPTRIIQLPPKANATDIRTHKIEE